MILLHKDCLYQSALKFLKKISLLSIHSRSEPIRPYTAAIPLKQKLLLVLGRFKAILDGKEKMALKINYQRRELRPKEQPPTHQKISGGGGEWRHGTVNYTVTQVF